jgi:Domain of unknown function (DUF4157)
MFAQLVKAPALAPQKAPAPPQATRLAAAPQEVRGASLGLAPFDFARIPIYPPKPATACAKAAPAARALGKSVTERPLALACEQCGEGVVLEQLLGSVAGVGRPLERGVRGLFSMQIGEDLSAVRVHADNDALRQVGARAMTIGQSLAFAPGAYRPDTAEGRRLIGHELAHVRQQRHAAGSPPSAPAAERQADDHAAAIAAGRKPGAALPALIGPAFSAGAGLQRAPTGAPRKIKDIVSDLYRAITFSRNDQAPLAAELADAVDASGIDQNDFPDIRDAVSVLSILGFGAEMDRVVTAARRKFAIAFWTQGLKVPNVRSALPEELINIGREAAKRGDHAQAFSMLEAAQEMLGEYAAQASENASNEIETEGPDEFNARSKRYGTLKEIYDQLRSIYAVYGELERDALIAGKPPEADELRKKGDALLERLRANRATGTLVEIGEASPSTNAEGKPALRYHGADFRETDLTALPGNPLPAEIQGQQAVPHIATSEGAEDALAQQAGLLAELQREPEFRNAFKTETPDLNDQATRQRAWRVMYGVYARRDGHPLGALMGLIGRYLKAYTIHTSFNVRDFGASYLDSRFPEDLTGRIVSDCGVYALNVAWDVFETVKTADPKLKVSFTLATLLDHIVLIIADDAAGQWYYVSNDQITPIPRTAGFIPLFPRPEGLPRSVDVFNEDPPAQAPKDPDRDEQVGKQYGELRDLPYLIVPINYADLGSTKDRADAFKVGTWSKYEASTAYMARAADPAFVKKPMTLANLQTFSDASKQLDAALNAAASLDAAGLSSQVSAHFGEAKDLLVAFEQLGPRAFKANPKLAATKPAGSTDSGALRAPEALHPLVRMALALIRLRKLLGHPLGGEQQQYLDYFEKAFGQQVSARRTEAEAGRF